jgi:hypothetical protein
MLVKELHILPLNPLAYFDGFRTVVCSSDVSPLFNCETLLDESQKSLFARQQMNSCSEVCDYFVACILKSFDWFYAYILRRQN